MYATATKRAARANAEFNRLTDEQEEQMERILSYNGEEKAICPEWDMEKQGFYFIDITGKYGVYYTLWRFRPSKSPYVKPEVYLTNLSIDPIEAATKARKMCGGIAPIMLDAPGNFTGLQGKPMVFTFGKYRGVHLGDIFATDPQYFVWLHKQIIRKEKSVERLSDENKARIAYFNDLHFENVTKRNRETISSAFVGTVDEELTNLTLTVKRVTKGSGYTSYKLVDASGNNYLAYYLPDTTQEGDIITPLTCKILAHKEQLGINYTKLGYFKFERKKKAAK